MDINAPNAPSGLTPIANLPLSSADILSMTTGRLPDAPAPAPAAGDRFEFSGKQQQQSLDAVTRKIMKAMHEALKRMADERAQARVEDIQLRDIEAARQQAQAADATQATDPLPDDTIEIKDPLTEPPPSADASSADKASAEAEKFAGALLSKLPTEATPQKPPKTEAHRRFHPVQPEQRISFDRLKLEKAQKLSAGISAAIDSSSIHELSSLHTFDTADSMN